MKRIPHFFLFLCMTLVTSCEKEHMDDCFQGTGDIVRRERSVGTFHTIDVEQKVDVIIRHDSNLTVEVEAGENIIEGITTEVSEGTLFISNHNRCNWVRSYSHPIKVYLTLPRLDGVYQHGNGTVSSDGLLAFDTLAIDVWNSGDIRLHVQSEMIYVRQHVSVGDVILTGSVGHLYVYNNGNGFSRQENLSAQEAQVDARGTGDTYVRVDNLLEYGITGSGNIYLYGGATATGTSTGAGQLIRQ